MKHLALLLVSQIMISASAQTVLNADSTSIQPVISRDVKGFDSCGVRVVTGSLSQAANSEIYDFSLTAWENAMVLFKAGSYVVPFNTKTGWDIKTMKPRLPGPDAFWIAKRDDAVATAPPKFMKTESPGFSMGMPESNAGISMLWAVAYGKPMQVSLRYGSKGLDRIVAFEAHMDPRDLEAFQACTAGLLKRMETAHPPKK